MKKCPKCGGTEFIVSAHVVQDWLVDENGNYIRTVEDYVETSHRPDDDDIWMCYQCGHDAAGREFNIKE